MCVTMLFSAMLLSQYFMMETIRDKDLVDKYYFNQIVYCNAHARNLTATFT